MVSRRDMIKGAGAAAALSVFGAGYVPRLFPRPGFGGGHPAQPDLTFLHAATEIKYSVCLQCHSGCGIRTKVVGGRLIKIDGNPYHPNTLEPHIPYSTDPQEALGYVGTTCAKGQAGIEALYDPKRLRTPLKRAGPRGSGRWEVVSWEQAVNEITNGATLPGSREGDAPYTFEGLREIRKYISKNDVEGLLGSSIGEFVGRPKQERDVHVSSLSVSDRNRLEENLIDINRPELGPKSNQLIHMVGRAEHGRKEFTDRFFGNSFGTLNMRNDHTDICELSHHVAYNLVSGKTHAKPDIINTEYLLLFGASYLEASFPFQTLARKMMQATNEGSLKYVVIDPRYSQTAMHASKWVPVKPGMDAALALGMISWIIENDAYDARFLENTSKDAASIDGETTWTNATSLVQVQGDGAWKMLKREGKEMVIDSTAESVVPFDSVDHGVIDGETAVDGVQVKTSFRLLKESANQHTIEEWAELAGVSSDVIMEMAREFTSHGKMSVAEFYRGPVQHTNGVWNALAIISLNLLIGNVDWKGGLSFGGSHWHEMGSKAGNPYFPDKEMHKTIYPEGVSPWGIRVSRAGTAYEETTEFTDKAYPATRPYYPLHGKDMSHACLEGIAAEYPYSAKAVFITMANFNYSTPGMKNVINESFTDSEKVPLLVTFDIIVGELSDLADYILAEGTYLEQWGTPHVAPTLQTKISGVRQPVVDLLYPETRLLEDWIIEIGKAGSFPGFGSDALGPGIDLDSVEDWYRMSIANIAMEGNGVQNGASEAEQMEYVLSRGGRFEDYVEAYDGDRLSHKFGSKLNLYTEALGSLKDSMTGKFFPGIATYVPQADALGNSIDDPEYPLQLITYKTAIHTQSRTIANPSLVQMFPENWVEINSVDAEALGIVTGDKVRITSKTNSVGEIGTAKLREGIRPGVISVSHNYGHWRYGAASVFFGDQVITGDESRAAGLTANPVMRMDTSLGGVAIGDKGGGSISFFDTKVKVEKA